MTRCSVCRTNVATIKGRCRICDAYKRRTGRERPTHLAQRQAELNYKKRIRAQELRSA